MFVGSQVMTQENQIQQPAVTPQIPSGNEANKDARTFAMWCHLGGLAGFLPIVPAVGSIIAPLIIWQIKKEGHPFVDEQGKEAVNFQISMVLYALVGCLACFMTCICILLIPAVLIVVGLADLILLLIAAVKANNGEHYRYPMSIRFIK
jgi:uncharacterized Tic20 family protein